KFCSMGGCPGTRNLRQCAKCKTVYYCSKECQRSHWLFHKSVCNHNIKAWTVRGNTEGQEPFLQKNLRHWVIRFQTTLLATCIRALNLKSDWDRLDQVGLVISGEPRPHPHPGSRWRITAADVCSNDEITEILQEAGLWEQYRDEIFPLHNAARERLRNDSRERWDYVYALTFAANDGKDKFEGEHSPTFRFTPFDVGRGVVDALPNEFFEVDWLQDLRSRIEEDRPMNNVPFAI
ncbi:MYND-type domain-containing protein, partial [Favolaschia claudopus]